MQMATPMAAIYIGPWLWAGHVHTAYYACAPHQIYKRGVPHTPVLTFWLTLDGSTSCTITLSTRHSPSVSLNLSK